MVKNSKKDHPLLLDLVKTSKSQKQLAEELGMPAIEFSKLINGLKPIPDPRDPDNLEIYSKMARRLEMTPEKLIQELLPFENTSAFWRGFEKRKADLSKEKRQFISNTTSKKLDLIKMNLALNEEYLDVLLSNFRSYIEDVKGWEWIETQSKLDKCVEERKTKQK